MGDELGFLEKDVEQLFEQLSDVGPVVVVVVVIVVTAAAVVVVVVPFERRRMPTSAPIAHS